MPTRASDSSYAGTLHVTVDLALDQADEPVRTYGDLARLILSMTGSDALLVAGTSRRNRATVARSPRDGCPRSDEPSHTRGHHECP
jgi:hypothetical protein